MKNLVGHHFWDCFYVFLPVDKIPELTLARLFAFRSGIWNGKDENAPITFEQLATMV